MKKGNKKGNDKKHCSPLLKFWKGGAIEGTMTTDSLRMGRLDNMTEEERKRFEEICDDCYKADLEIEEETEDPLPFDDEVNFDSPEMRELAERLGISYSYSDGESMVMVEFVDDDEDNS